MQEPAPHAALLQRLLRLMGKLYAESEDYFDHPEQEQLWYNRGYADGMLQALRDLGYAEDIRDQVPAGMRPLPPGFEVLSWGRAYLHGQTLGSRETREVLVPRRADL
ncbi:MAG: hypothetical protein ACLGH6_03660 [Gammaproteobacteria bacterium]